MGTTYQFKLKIKICVTKSKKLNSDVAIREMLKTDAKKLENKQKTKISIDLCQKPKQCM